jgi:hypothetical protein
VDGEGCAGGAAMQRWWLVYVLRGMLGDSGVSWVNPSSVHRVGFGPIKARFGQFKSIIHTQLLLQLTQTFR